MAKYIDREALIEWLKRIPLKDLSDGLGLCRIIMEDDLKKAIKEMPEGIIVDAVPVVRCTDCMHSYGAYLCGGYCTYCDYLDCVVQPDFYCADGKRSEAARGVE